MSKFVRMKICALISLPVLASCIMQSDAPEERIKKALREESALFDPESVQLRNIRASKDDKHYCGELNAKNRFGGYVGWKRFTLTKNGNAKASIYIEGMRFADGGLDKETEELLLGAGDILCAP